MALPDAVSHPNSHFAYIGEVAQPLVSDRSCELAVECWTLRQDIQDMKMENEKLKACLSRLNFAVRRSNESLKEVTSKNSSLERAVKTLTKENLQLQKELTAEKSTTFLQSRVIESNKRTIKKVKTSSEKSKKFTESMRTTSASEQSFLKFTIEDLRKELEEKNRIIQDNEATEKRLLEENTKLQGNITSMKSKIQLVQTELRAEKAKVSQMQSQYNEVAIGDESYTQAFVELEQAYEELHTKYECLWDENNTLNVCYNKLEKERDYYLNAALNAGVRIGKYPLEDDSDCDEDESSEIFD
mmetsp:Transcript_8522/g.12722  ORF Transcript_8522/g.12722 Transcript_8522/m.12722 type:complete len:300 (+) Transcript_8522:56-955(+)